MKNKNITVQLGNQAVVVTLGEGTTAKGCGALFSYGLLTLQSVKKKKKIGAKAADKDLVGQPINILFANDDAVVALIQDLSRLRKEMKAYAANDNTDGHPKQQRKISRKRTKR